MNNRRLSELDDAAITDTDGTVLDRLGEARLGYVGVISKVSADDAADGGLPGPELERRLLEMGFVEGARVEILHQGLVRRDPIAVRVDDMRVALRRADARSIFVRRENGPVR